MIEYIEKQEVLKLIAEGRDNCYRRGEYGRSMLLTDLLDKLKAMPVLRKKTPQEILNDAVNNLRDAMVEVQPRIPENLRKMAHGVWNEPFPAPVSGSIPRGLNQHTVSDPCEVCEFLDDDEVSCQECVDNAKQVYDPFGHG